MSDANKFTDLIKFRAPDGLRKRLKAIAKFHGTKYQHEARTGVLRYADQEEAAMKAQNKKA